MESVRVRSDIVYTATKGGPLFRAIVEAEIHERIFEGTWKVIPRWDRKDRGTA